MGVRNITISRQSVWGKCVGTYGVRKQLRASWMLSASSEASDTSTEQQKSQTPNSDAEVALKEATEDERGAPGRWAALAALLFPFGCLLGPPLDGLHSSVGLQTYEAGAVTLELQGYALATNIWVFPLLGAMYSVVGVLQVALDRKFGSPGQKQLTASWTAALISLGVLAGQLRLSAQLYDDGVDYSLIAVILFACAQLSWLAFDRTPWGWALAALVAAAAPLSEVFIMKWFVLWTYNAPDIEILGEGVVSWTVWCYFFYVQFVATLARCIAPYLLPPAHQQELLQDTSGQDPVQ